jgi:tetratricopeptide (TPR) repeat protein
MTAKVTTFTAGVLDFRDAKYNEAIRRFSVVCSLNPSSLARWLTYQQALLLGAQTHMMLDSRAAAYEKLGRYKEALLDSHRVIEKFPDLPHVGSGDGSF